MGAAVEMVDALPPDLRDRAFLGETVRVPVRDLPPAAQQACWKSQFDLKPRSVMGRNGTPGGRDQPAKDDWLRNTTLILGHGSAPSAQDVSLNPMFQQQPGSAGSKVAEIMHVPKGTDESGSIDYTKMFQSGPNPNRARGPAGMEKIPALQKRVILPARNDGDITASRLIPALVKVAGLPLIGEYDPCAQVTGFSENSRMPAVPLRLLTNKGREMPLWELIELTCEAFDLDWNYQGGWLVLHSPRTLLSWAGIVDLSPLPARP